MFIVPPAHLMNQLLSGAQCQLETTKIVSLLKELMTFLPELFYKHLTPSGRLPGRYRSRLWLGSRAITLAIASTGFVHRGLPEASSEIISVPMWDLCDSVVKIALGTFTTEIAQRHGEKNSSISLHPQHWLPKEKIPNDFLNV